MIIKYLLFVKILTYVIRTHVSMTLFYVIILGEFVSALKKIDFVIKESRNFKKKNMKLFLFAYYP